MTINSEFNCKMSLLLHPIPSGASKAKASCAGHGRSQHGPQHAVSIAADRPTPTSLRSRCLALAEPITSMHCIVQDIGQDAGLPQHTASGSNQVGVNAGDPWPLGSEPMLGKILMLPQMTMQSVVFPPALIAATWTANFMTMVNGRTMFPSSSKLIRYSASIEGSVTS